MATIEPYWVDRGIFYAVIVLVLTSWGLRLARFIFNRYRRSRQPKRDSRGRFIARAKNG